MGAYRKIGHAFFLAVFLCLCLTGAVCGFIVADNNTRAVANGYADAVIAAAQKDRSLSVRVDKDEFSLTLPEGFGAYAEIMPYPIGNFFSFYAEIKQILAEGG